MLCKGCYQISMVLAFSYGQAKTIKRQYVNLVSLGTRLTIRVDAYNLKTEKKSPFSKKYPDTSGRGLIYGITIRSVVT